MSVARMIKISAKNKLAVSQLENGKIILEYDNANVYFNEGAFLNLLIEADQWSIDKETGLRSEMVIQGCRFNIRIKPEHMDDLVTVLNEAAYKLLPLLKMCKDVYAQNDIRNHRFIN